MNIPFYFILALAIIAKMKLKNSLTDIPYAVTDAETLSEIGWNIRIQMDIMTDIHILDCTEIQVELDNDNYGYSEVIKDKKGISRGYKLSTIRGIVGDTGILEEVN